jgi:hypothetical protein
VLRSALQGVNRGQIADRSAALFQRDRSSRAKQRVQ